MSLHTNLKKQFEEKYYSMTEQVYYWTVKDAANLKKMIAKIRYSFKAKFQKEPDETEIEQSFTLIMERLPAWYKQHLSLPLINSHYNEVIQQIKAKGQREQKQNDSLGKTFYEKYGNAGKDNRSQEIGAFKTTDGEGIE